MELSPVSRMCPINQSQLSSAALARVAEALADLPADLRDRVHAALPTVLNAVAAALAVAEDASG